MSVGVHLAGHARVFAVVGALVLALAVVLPLDSPALVLAALGVAVVFGMPHGALDLPRARHRLGVRGIRRLAGFLAIYLGLIGLCVALWFIQPLIALAVFLAYSMWHFSHDWCFDDRLARTIGGLSTVGAPALAHRNEVEALLVRIVGGADTAIITAVLAIAGGAALLGLVPRCVLRRDRAALELGLLWLLATVVSPLVFFAVYYGALHALRQSEIALRDLGDAAGPALRESIGASIGVIVAGGVAIAVSVLGAGLTVSEAMLRAVFIGLAALTVPHMLLDALLDRWATRRRVG